ncbi:MAG: tRNA (adenosine(37)-N6)-dimethylallyltransferase MiaA [Cytophagales bacterium]|nr:tRNA (adenosine(37)-N6)-dimethylallyltransferase MiaA [Cytophagales bacterium]
MQPSRPSLAAAKPIRCIAGPTASGKSRLALDYAAHQAARGLAVELICVDSATIYRGMDIGTAKPSAQEQAICPHHLLDIREPSQSYNAGAFARDAARLIGEIRARAAEPVLVGGTMLYFKALMDGIDELPTADLAIRAEIEQEAQSLGWQALHANLALIDPLTAARLSPNDSQRISRALEVYRATGKPLSGYFKTEASPQATSDLTFQLIALEPQSRQGLHERIAARFDAMLASGLVDEVRALHKRGDLNADLPAMRCVGYRQVWAFLDGACSESEMRERGIAATRQLAKRQLTWLRGWAGKISMPLETATLETLITLAKHR